MKVPALVTLLLAALAAGTWFMLGKKTEAEPLDISFYFMCDVRGRLVPCGCFTGQYGGLTRLKTILKEDTSPHSIRVDIGDAIRGAEDYNIIEYKYILQAYAAMKFDALNMGHREVQLPAAELAAIKEQSPVSLISANLLHRENGAPVLDRYKVIERGGHRIALIGIVDPRGVESLGEGLRVDSMDATLSNLLPELKGKADVFALLAFTDEQTLRQLARDFYEFSLILGGNVSQPSQQLERENQSYILYAANESRTLGLFRGRVSPEARLTALDHDLMLLVDTIPEHAEVVSLAQEYRTEVRNTPLDIDDPANLQANMVPGVRATATYVGSENCIACHQSAAEIWRKSAHSHAFRTLVQYNADADPNCIACHTVGFGTPSGYFRKFADTRLTDVGCESCHGPGSLHVQQHQEGLPITFKFRPLGPGDCMSCHYGEFSRPFEWEEFWPQIAHGNEAELTAFLLEER